MAKRLTLQEQDWRLTPERGPGGVQETVKESAEIFGWKYCHFNDSRRQVTRGGKTFFVGDKDAVGWPDTFMVRGREMLVAECKKELGLLTNEQRLWLIALDEANLECWIVRPSNLHHFCERLSARENGSVDRDAMFDRAVRGLSGEHGLVLPSASRE